MAKVHIDGLMVKFIQGAGLKVNNMVKGNIHILQEKLNIHYMNMVNEKDG